MKESYDEGLANHTSLKWRWGQMEMGGVGPHQPTDLSIYNTPVFYLQKWLRVAV